MFPGIFQFADFELDMNVYELRRNGNPLKLERIPLNLLFLLVDQRNRLVTREEIIEHIWGKGVFLDTDNAINSAVRKLRRALDDDPEAPRFIITIPTRGYRFVGALRESSAPASHGPGANFDDAGLSYVSPIRYARTGNVHIAYRIFGDRERDIVMIPGTLSHLEISWESPAKQHLLKRLTAFARVIIFDKRGQGLSDRVVAEQTLEERIDDVRAVMDAAGSKRATIYGWSEGGPMSLMFAATYPERVTALVLYGTFASVKDKPWAASRNQWEEMLGEWEAHWGEGILLRVNAPSVADDPVATQLFGTLERASASPGSIVALMRANYEMDVRHILRTIAIPTLVIHRIGDVLVPVAAGRYLAEHIPGAKYVEMPGTDHSITDSDTQNAIADEIEKFITGDLNRPEPDRVLSTVMFTEIEESGPHGSQVRKPQSPELLKNSYQLLRSDLPAFRGRELKTSGDGLMATFDGPARAIRFACSAREKVREMGLQIRSGLHTGECELTRDEMRGLAVDIARRVTSLADPDEVLLSSTVKDLVAGSNIQFVDRGIITLEAVPGEWQVFKVAD